MDTRTTQSPWTDMDVTRVASAIHRLDQYALTYVDCDLFATTVLDALAPRVAELQRAAKVEALREAADTLSERTEGPSRAGTAKWSEDYRDAYSLAIEEAAGVLSRSADEIERGDR